MISSLSVILLLLAAGHACARWGLVGDDDAMALNRFVLNVCLPAIVLALVPSLRPQPSFVALALVPWLLLLASSALVLLCARLFRFSREVEGALLLCVGLGNTSFLGYPMIEALLGPDALRLAVVYDQLGSFLMLATFGLLIQSRYGGAGQQTPLLRRLFTFPPFLALLAAALLMPFPVPPPFTAAMRRIGDALMPAAMFAVGLRIRLRLPPERGAFFCGLALKMALLPLISWPLARALGASPEVLRVVVLQSSTPPMITAGAIAISAGLAPELAAALVGYGVLAAMAVMPAWAALAR